MLRARQLQTLSCRAAARAPRRTPRDPAAAHARARRRSRRPARASRADTQRRARHSATSTCSRAGWRGEPIAYILGEREFYGLAFEVSARRADPAAGDRAAGGTGAGAAFPERTRAPGARSGHRQRLHRDHARQAAARSSKSSRPTLSKAALAVAARNVRTSRRVTTSSCELGAGSSRSPASASISSSPIRPTSPRTIRIWRRRSALRAASRAELRARMV